MQFTHLIRVAVPQTVQVTFRLSETDDAPEFPEALLDFASSSRPVHADSTCREKRLTCESRKSPFDSSCARKQPVRVKVTFSLQDLPISEEKRESLALQAVVDQLIAQRELTGQVRSLPCHMSESLLLRDGYITWAYLKTSDFVSKMHAYISGKLRSYKHYFYNKVLVPNASDCWQRVSTVFRRVVVIFFSKFDQVYIGYFDPVNNNR